ncbi:MAG: hypothetical protein AAF297_10855 [Planctomycetota bacterium]
MLKFLRKYQLIILAIGGSLLMVVFLLEPILSRLQPNPANKEVAELNDGSSVTRGDRDRARATVQALGDFLPWLPGALGLDADHPGDHFLLLAHAADKAGLIGEDGDGAGWTPELASIQLQFEIQALRQQGRFLSPEEQQRLPEQVTAFIDQQRNAVAARNRIPPVEFDRMLARARGILRYRNLYITAPRLSDRRLVSAAQEQGAAAIVDAVVFTPRLIARTIEDPTDVQLQEHFDRYAAVRPGNTEDNPFGLGYRLPDRVKLEYLRLNPEEFEGVVEVDRIELRKRWQRSNPTGTDAEFAAARGRLEDDLRAEQADELMEEADQIVRGELLRLIRPLETEGPYAVVPDTWPAAGPDYESIAQLVVRQIEERLGVRIPTPTVVRRDDAWLPANDLSRLPGLGSAEFRVGSQAIPAPLLPQYVREINESEALRAQVGVPILDPFATDARGNHYYITVLGARAESAPDSLDEVRDQVLQNTRSVLAYERLVELGEPARVFAAEGGLEAAARFIADEAGLSADVALPEVARDLIVFDGGVSPTLPGEQSPQELRTDAFTDPVLDLARTLDPFAQLDTADAFDTTLAVNIPRIPGLVLTRVRAVRPITEESFRASGERLVNEILQGETAEFTTDAQVSPFSLDNLIARLGYTFDFSTDDDFSIPASEPDTADETTDQPVEG